MPDYIALYRAYLEQEKHASPNTVSSYVRDLTQFRVWLPPGSDLRPGQPRPGGCAGYGRRSAAGTAGKRPAGPTGEPYRCGSEPNCLCD